MGVETDTERERERDRIQRWGEEEECCLTLKDEWGDDVGYG